jgi:hypothetical protein
LDGHGNEPQNRLQALVAILRLRYRSVGVEDRRSSRTRRRPFLYYATLAVAALMFAYEDVFCVGGADGLAANMGVPPSADAIPVGAQKSALKKWIWVIAGIVIVVGLLIWFATPKSRRHPRAQAPKTLRAVPGADELVERRVGL